MEMKREIEVKIQVEIGMESWRWPFSYVKEKVQKQDDIGLFIFYLL